MSFANPQELSPQDERLYRMGKYVQEIIENVKKGIYLGNHVVAPFIFPEGGFIRANFETTVTQYEDIKNEKGETVETIVWYWSPAKKDWIK